MVQSVNSSNNNYGSIKRTGSTPDGRIIFDLVDPNGETAGRLSVAQKDSDLFEKSFNVIQEKAPKLQKYMDKKGPEGIEKDKQRTKWTIGISTFIGGIIPALKAKGEWYVQIPLTLLGTAAGFFAGNFIASQALVPPGTKEISQATQTISKLDIKQA